MSNLTRPSGRVVVTGFGAVTPLGTGAEKFWPRLLAGESGVGRITHLDPSEFSTQIAAEVKDFNPEDWLEKKDARRVDRFIIFAAAATQMAIRNAGFPEDKEIRERTGVMIGSGIGGLTLLGEQYRRMISGGPGKLSPFLVPYMIPDMASGYVSILHGLKGPNACVVTACATGASCIGDAYHVIKRGDAVAMVAGGTEAPINDIGLGGFCSARTLSTRNDDPEHASRPFDKNRAGFVMSEGAGSLMLEDLDFAKSRGANILAEVVGYGLAGDAYHITAPDPEGDGARRAMVMAIKNAGVKPEDIGYINAHGTSTELNDKLETLAVKRAFGDAAYKVAMSSTKSMLGHMLGAAGAVEAIISILAIRDGMLPPTTNYETPDPECDLDYVPNKARACDVKLAMSNSFGFGGHNVSLLLSKYEG